MVKRKKTGKAGKAASKKSKKSVKAAEKKADVSIEIPEASDSLTKKAASKKSKKSVKAAEKKADVSIEIPEASDSLTKKADDTHTNDQTGEVTEAVPESTAGTENLVEKVENAQIEGTVR